MCEWRTVKTRMQPAEAALSQRYVCQLSLRGTHMDDQDRPASIDAGAIIHARIDSTSSAAVDR